MTLRLRSLAAAVSVALAFIAAPVASAEPDDNAPPGDVSDQSGLAPAQSGNCEFSAGDGADSSCASEPTDSFMFGFDGF